MIRHLCSTVYWVYMCVQVHVCAHVWWGGWVGNYMCQWIFQTNYEYLSVTLPFPHHSDPLHSGWLITEYISYCLERIQTCVLYLIVLVFCACGKKAENNSWLKWKFNRNWKRVRNNNVPLYRSSLTTKIFSKSTKTNHSNTNKGVVFVNELFMQICIVCGRHKIFVYVVILAFAIFTSI